MEYLNILLKDNTTKKNIVWATNDYENISASDEIQLSQINLIRSRYEKVREQQKNRTRDRAEIFTPTWICNEQNNLIDENFDRKNWQEYILKKILEITCGEAPYLVSRYDAVSGEKIPVKNRIGMLDRKLKVVSEQTENIEDWLYWAKKSVQNIYGYELQGDNLFIARKNIFLTVQEFFEEKFKFSPPQNFLKEIAKIISWNVWQMDGLKNTAPFSKQPAKQENLFDTVFEEMPCKIMDWEKNEVWEFTEPKEGRKCLRKVLITS